MISPINNTWFKPFQTLMLKQTLYITYTIYYLNEMANLWPDGWGNVSTISYLIWSLE